MDDLDRKLLILLGASPRARLQDMAKKLGISRQAVHHRMQRLTKMGVIKQLIAGISVSYLNAVPVAVSGFSKTGDVEETMERLGQSEFTRRVVVAGGNYIYVVGFLREISELEGFVDFVKRVGEISDPLVGIYCLDDGLMQDYFVDGGGRRRESYKKLSPLDMKIIASLGDNARRPVSEVACLVGASAKTVRRHLDNMISDGSLDLSLPVDMASGNMLMFLMHINLKDGADKRVVGRCILSKRYFEDQYIRTYRNIPKLLVWVFWSDDINQVRKALMETTHDDHVAGTMLNFGYLERIFLTTWRDKLPEETVEANRRSQKPSRRSRPRNS